MHRYSIEIFPILVLQEYWLHTASRIPLKPVLGDMRIVAIFISSNESESAVFYIIVVSISEGSVFPDYYDNSILVKRLKWTFCRQKNSVFVSY